MEGISLRIVNSWENLCALCQLLLELSYRIVTVAPVGCLLRVECNIEEEFLTCIGSRVVFQINSLCSTCSTIQLLESTILYWLTISEESPLKIELVEVAVKILISQLHLTAVFVQVEGYPLVNTLHLV